MKTNQKIKLLFLLAVGFLSIVLLVGVGEGGVTAEFQPQSPSVADGWTAECIDCLRYFSGMSGNSAALDSSSLIHTAYGGDSLYYAVQNPDDTYTTEVVDANPERGLNASMVLDSNDRPHILYYAGDLLRLNYAYYDGASWRITSLPTGDLTALPHPWLVIDGNDELHVAFIDGEALVYGFYDQNSWQLEMVDTGDVGRPSLDLDSSERPHIAYGRGGKYAYYDGANWQYTTFAGTYDVGESIAIILDSNDLPHIVYQTEFDGSSGLDLRYRFNDGNNWQIEDVDTPVAGVSFQVGYDISLVFDATDQPILAFTTEFSSGTPYPWFEFYAVMLGRRDQNGWQVEVLSEPFVTVADKNYATMLPGPGSSLIFVYKEINELKSAVFQNDVLTTTTIDQSNQSGTHIDMAVDSEDYLHISAHEQERYELRYATDSQGGWTAETLAGSGFVGIKWTSIALTEDNRPFIMFDHYDRPGALPYIYFDGQDWVLDPNYLIDNYNFEVAMDSADNFHVAYFDARNSHKVLVHQVRSASGVWSQPVDIDGEIIEDYVQLDIAIDSADFPHIAYPATDGLQYAVETPSGWVTETVTGGAVDYPSLALDRFGRPHIAWYDIGIQDLRYATFDGATWQVATLDSGGDVGQYPSLAVDRTGRVYIAYYDATNGDLKYASYDGDSWTIETLLSDGDVGSFSKLVMPYAGYPAIAYYDATARDLMLLYRPFQPTNLIYHPIVRGANP